MAPRGIRPFRTAQPFVSLLLLTSAGCATAAGYVASPAENAPEAVTVVVDNQSPDIMRIYLVVNGGLELLGRVEGLSEARFRLRPLATSTFDDFRIQAMPTLMGAEGWTSQHLVPEPGEQVRVTVRNFLPMSVAEIRRY